MFSIPSFSKIIVLVAIIAAVWYGFRWIGQLDRARKKTDRRPQATRKDAGGGPRAGVEETVRCPVCDAFVAAKGASSCGRPDCPY